MLDKYPVPKPEIIATHISACISYSTKPWWGKLKGNVMNTNFFLWCINWKFHPRDSYAIYGTWGF